MVQRIYIHEGQMYLANPITDPIFVQNLEASTSQDEDKDEVWTSQDELTMNPKTDKLLDHVDTKTGLESFLPWLSELAGPVTLEQP